ncbi:HD domain-containing protein [Paenibacillus thermoaerophilus]|uniref:HD domain-containing protein n=1 Tax=Paenibacillus thermoaerophilus TaxID=1215385 RepID=A0ABW2V0U3_9BACL|nr:HD domain-containing protein [Paenibacillus thermoaerophilus]TMV15867.1 HD domain-containing protein [Paenibacillus thermoaerophilus]
MTNRGREDREGARAAAVKAAEWLARERLGGEASGHDWHHADRVRRMALRLAPGEGADPFVCELAALLHDIADRKLVPDEELALTELESWLKRQPISGEDAGHVMEIIRTMSFRGGSGPPMRTPEGRVVQDADRLDAIGAIGIARTFAYGGRAGRPIFAPADGSRAAPEAADRRPPESGPSAVGHFYDKLLLLKDKLNTAEARAIAERRHRFMLAYLEQFYAEWEG